MSNEEFYKKYPHYRPAPGPKKPFDHHAFVEGLVFGTCSLVFQIILPIWLVVKLLQWVF